MRVVGEITKSDCKVTIFYWNNRYIVKLERGLLEQTFKLHEYDVVGEADVFKILDSAFIQESIDRFETMAASLSEALKRS